MEKEAGFRVRFPVDQTHDHDSEIVVRNEGDNQISVHLGFLKVSHHYTIKFSIKDDLSEDLEADPLQNLNCRINHVMPSEDGEGHDLQVELKAYKEKLLREVLVLRDSIDSSKSLTLILHARVLGKHKGTPALKHGIHCSGIDPDDDSEYSDWQGF